MEPDRDHLLRFRARRHRLAGTPGTTPAAALVVPASDVGRDAAALAVGARVARLERASWDAAVDAGEIVVGHGLRGALHAVRPEDAPLFGPALISDRPEELLVQLGEGAKRHLAATGLDPCAALAQVAEAARDALAGDEPIDRDGLHAAWRERLPEDLLPWCKGCKSHHVSPMLWRYALVASGARRDAASRFVPGRTTRTPPAADAVRRFVSVYGPTSAAAFATWAGVARPHAERLWAEVADELVEVRVEGRAVHLLDVDLHELGGARPVRGLRLLPPGDPYLQHANRPALVPDKAVAKRLFTMISSPGAVLVDGRLGGIWRVRAKGRVAAIEVEALAELDRDALAAAAEHVAAIRGADPATVAVSG